MKENDFRADGVHLAMGEYHCLSCRETTPGWKAYGIDPGFMHASFLEMRAALDELLGPTARLNTAQPARAGKAPNPGVRPEGPTQALPHFAVPAHHN